jgi:hypothetical protein
MPEDGINFTLFKVDCGDLPKTALVLIEKISDAIGAACLPWQIERVAAAEGRAALTKTEYTIKAMDLQRRAASRVIADEIRQQQNIEDTVKRAIPDLKETANPTALDDDWIRNFFDKSGRFSGEQMQALFARVLAGQANLPGSFSRRAVNLLADMEVEDAHMFATLCSYAFGAKHDTPVILNVEHPIYSECGIDSSMLRHLQSIGLVIYDEVNPFRIQPRDENSTFETEYFGRPLMTAAPGMPFDVGPVVLTAVGKELAPISGATEIPSFYEFVLESLGGSVCDPCQCV